MMALHENETKYNATALLDHEMGYDDAIHYALHWDWNRNSSNSSHTGLIEVPSTSDNPAHLRDKVGRARDDDSDMKRLYYLLRIRNPTTLFHRSSAHKIARDLYNGILRLGLQQEEIHPPLAALMRLLRQTRQAVR